MGNTVSFQLKPEDTGADRPAAPNPAGGKPNQSGSADPLAGNPAIDAGKPAADPTLTIGSESRPEWLPPKFKTPADFAKAYEELEKKQSTPAADPSKPASAV